MKKAMTAEISQDTFNAKLKETFSIHVAKPQIQPNKMQQCDAL